MQKVRLIPASLATTMVVKLVMIAALLAGCAAVPEVRVDQAPASDISAYQTFSFHEFPGSDRGSTYTSLMSARLKQSARDELEHHGYVYREQDPDLTVSYDLRVRERQELRSFPMNGGVFVRRAGLGDVEVVSYRQGTVSIDLVDSHLKALVWQGVADGRIDDRMMEDPGKAIDTVVKQIFVGFPLAKAAPEPRQ